MTDKSAEALFYAVWLVFPLSALLARRMPLASTARMALAWAAIFAGMLVLAVGWRHYAPLWSRFSEAVADSGQSVSGGEVRLQMADDGHFWARADLNGVRRRMLIDSGATTTALSADTAAAAGIAVEESPFPTVLNTANGSITARVGTLKSLKLGPIEGKDLAVVVSPAFGDTDVLGMNFLSQLRSWRVEGQVLILQPRS